MMFLFSLLPYKFGRADVEFIFKMLGEYLGGVIPKYMQFPKLAFGFLSGVAVPVSCGWF